MEEGKIYICGPISGYDLEERKTVFEHVEVRLSNMGYEVFNPLKNGLPEDAEYHEHMRADIRAMTECGAIAFLPGWEKSEGCRAELVVAAFIGAEMFFAPSEILNIETE